MLLGLVLLLLFLLFQLFQESFNLGLEGRCAFQVLADGCLVLDGGVFQGGFVFLDGLRGLFQGVFQGLFVGGPSPGFLFGGAHEDIREGEMRLSFQRGGLLLFAQFLQHGAEGAFGAAAFPRAVVQERLVELQGPRRGAVRREGVLAFLVGVPGLLEVSGLEGLGAFLEDGARGGGRGGLWEQQGRQEERQAPWLGRAFAGRQDDAQGQQNHCGQKEEGIALLLLNQGFLLEGLLFGGGDRLAVEVPEIEVAGANGQIDSAGGGVGHRLEGLGIQPGAHGLSMVLQKRLLSLFVGDGEEGACLVVTQSHDEQADLEGPQGLRGLHRKGVVVLAVGDEDHIAALAGGVVEDLVADHPEGVPQVRAAPRQGAGGHLVQGHLEECVVQGGRTEDGGGPGKAHQRHAVTLQHFQALRDLRLGALQSVGAQILGKHAPGEVHKEDNLPTLPLDLLADEAPGGVRQCEEASGRRQKEQRILCHAQCGVAGGLPGGQGWRILEGIQAPHAVPAAQAEHQCQQGYQGEPR